MNETTWRWFGALTIATAACGDDGGSSRDTTPTTGVMPTSGSPTADGSDDDPSGPATSDETSAGPATATGTTSDPTSDDGSTDTGDPPMVALPPANAGLDYQLGGAYPPPADVEIVSRDRTASPEPGLYNICYVNGFQTQPGEQDWWESEHPDLLLRDEMGNPFIDPDWNEVLLDITTPDKRDALAVIVGDWIEQCGTDGFDAVEIDNLDTYSRSDNMISEDNAVDYMAMLSSTAHAAGMAIAQKNSAEIVSRRDELGTDFVVAEECNRYDECQDFTAAYGDAVLVVEYRPQDFDAGCADFPQLSIVLRDLNLVPAGDGDYVYDSC